MPEILKNLFEKLFGNQLIDCQMLTQAGSNRQYYRLCGKNICAAGVAGASIDENRAFEKIAKHLYDKGISVPEFFAASDDGLYYLQEYLGDVSLFDFIIQGRKSGVFSAKERNVLHATIAQLPEIQFKGAEDFDFSFCYPQPAFDKLTVMWDLNYFKYCFLKLQNVDFQENKLETDFTKFAEILLNVPLNSQFMYRDFQSRNVMLKNMKPYFIDFQGARRGPVYYDLASFLWQASANFTPQLKEELTQTYFKNLKNFADVNEREFRKNLDFFVLFRTLQVLGTYGFRGIIEKKQYFTNNIQSAIKNLKEILLKIEKEKLPYLFEVLNKMIEIQQYSATNISSDSIKTDLADSKGTDNFLVRVFSFSYRKGIPADVSGNGGGFVFDCRAIHNPGKYVEYRDLTGLDTKVAGFLEKNSEIAEFLGNCYALIDKSVVRYLERGFTALQISFGCTGGQHRSVYSAQKTAEHLYTKFGIRVQLVHVELNIESKFPDSNYSEKK
ncbi:MAG: phosphotransferase [Prevotellaceae bacterium]|jgi:aminoglycoside/choline kinase family phosphotransferase|nr:phosphotransferase [Prevotellaceae bacterium]